MRELMAFLVDTWGAALWAEAARRRVALRAVPVADLAATRRSLSVRSGRRMSPPCCGRCERAARWPRTKRSA